MPSSLTVHRKTDGGLRAFVDPPTEVDLAGYMVRARRYDRPVFNGATAVHNGRLTAMPLEFALAPGVWTIMAKAVDTSGNESDMASVLITVDGAGDVTLLDCQDDQALGWPGTKTNCSVVSGALVADAAAVGIWPNDRESVWPADMAEGLWPGDMAQPFWPNDKQSVWPADMAEGFWPSAMYKAMTYQTTFDAAAEGPLVIDAVLRGDFTVAWREMVPGPFWPEDMASSLWPADMTASVWPDMTPWRPYAVGTTATRGTIDVRLTAAGERVAATAETLTIGIENAA